MQTPVHFRGLSFSGIWIDLPSDFTSLNMLLKVKRIVSFSAVSTSTWKVKKCEVIAFICKYTKRPWRPSPARLFFASAGLGIWR